MSPIVTIVLTTLLLASILFLAHAALSRPSTIRKGETYYDHDR